MFRNIKYSKLDISRRCHFWVMFELRISCLGDIILAFLVCGMPYLMPTPTLGRALITFFTVFCSGNANIMDAVKLVLLHQTLKSMWNLLRLARKISIALFCNKYLRENIALTSVKYHFPCRWSQYFKTWNNKKNCFRVAIQPKNWCR